MTPAATSTGLCRARILLSLAVLPVSIALFYLYFPQTITHKADDVPASIYNIAVKVSNVPSWCEIC
jgi:hypothetical protein